jgi:hypothetical protein
MGKRVGLHPCFRSGSRQDKWCPKKEKIRKTFVSEKLSAGLEASPGKRRSYLEVQEKNADSDQEIFLIY